VTITVALVDTYSTQSLLRLVAAQQHDAGRFVASSWRVTVFDGRLTRAPASWSDPRNGV
jgi:hypothetical protein